MKIISVQTEHPLYALIEELYLQSFPKEERRPLEEWKKRIDETNDFRLCAIIHEDIFCGFISFWKLTKVVYIEHFAISSVMRNAGLGSLAISMFMSQVESPIVLEVELPTTDLAKRRIKFYEKMGFHLSDAPYMQPPYSPECSWLELKLMSSSSLIDLQTVISEIHTKVYGIPNS